MATYKSRDSARRQARKRGLDADSVYQDEKTARWAIKGTAVAKVEKAKDTAALRELDQLAKRINVGIKKAADYRLTVAVQLAEAKDKCAKIRIPFKKWIEENIEGNYQYVARLAKIGEADDPSKALQDLRAATNVASKKSQAKKVDLIKSTPKPKTAAEKPAGKLERAEAAMEILGPEGAKRFIEDKAAQMGLAVEKPKPVEAEFSDLEDMKRRFRTLTQADKFTFIEWACAEMEDPETVPPWLKREKQATVN